MSEHYIRLDQSAKMPKHVTYLDILGIEDKYLSRL
jgi:hypothetical protein